jgi:hypothetical protein
MDNYESQIKQTGLTIPIWSMRWLLHPWRLPATRLIWPVMLEARTGWYPKW